MILVVCDEMKKKKTPYTNYGCEQENSRKIEKNKKMATDMKSEGRNMRM